MSTQTEAPTLYERRRIEQRADALLILLNARFVDPEKAPGAMRVLGLSKGDMSEARRRVGALVSVPPAPVVMHSHPTYSWDDEKPAPLRQPTKAPTNARPIHEGQLRCSKCQKWKDEDEFSLRTDRIGSGTRRSACKSCHRLAGKERYLNVRAQEALTAIGVEFVVEEGDSSAKFICRSCGKPIEPGEDATVSGVVEHSSCVEGEA